MVQANLIYELGKTGASEEYVEAVVAATPDDAKNVARRYVESLYADTGVVAAPDHVEQPALYSLWLGNVEVAYREAGPNLAIVLEEAFSDAELGLVESSTKEFAESAI